jgi:low temperature requirement protein LtrA
VTGDDVWMPSDLLRHRADVGSGRVTDIELFFDLVYVFAVTQLSHALLTHPTWAGAGQTAVLLAMVWVIWAYTTWVTNWLDPNQLPVRMMLLALMLASLVMSAAIPRAYGDRGAWIGIAYAAMQVGRSVFAAASMSSNRSLQLNFTRITAWCVVSGACALAGGFAQGSAREWWWFAAVAVDLLGGVVGFYTPGLGRSYTEEWTIEGNHIAERCQAFVLIALGESLVVTGGTLAGLDHVSRGEAAAVLCAFLGAATLWWVYFDRYAAQAALVVAQSENPGRYGRSAYHLIHPIIVAGIIVTAAADERVLAHPSGHLEASTRWFVLGGTALFLAGHAAFIGVIWRRVSWNRVIAVGLLALLGIPALLPSALPLAAAAIVVTIGVAVTDRLAADRASADFRQQEDPSPAR